MQNSKQLISLDRVFFLSKCEFWKQYLKHGGEIKYLIYNFSFAHFFFLPPFQYSWNENLFSAGYLLNYNFWKFSKNKEPLSYANQRSFRKGSCCVLKAIILLSFWTVISLLHRHSRPSYITCHWSSAGKDRPKWNYFRTNQIVISL